MKHSRKEKPNIPHKYRCKNPNKNIIIESSNMKIKKYYNKVGFISKVQNWVNNWKAINVINHLTEYIRKALASL